MRHAELDEVRAALERHATALAFMFTYYANIVLGKWTSDAVQKMDLERFRIMVEDLEIIDARGTTCRTVNELDAIFVVRSSIHMLSIMLQHQSSATGFGLESARGRSAALLQTSEFFCRHSTCHQHDLSAESKLTSMPTFFSTHPFKTSCAGNQL